MKTATPIAPLLITIPEMARRLGISEREGYRVATRGGIAVVQIGKLRRVPAAALDTFVANAVAVQTT